MKLLTLLCITLLMLSCAGDDMYKQLDQEVDVLTTVEKQAKFLEEIFEKDQEVRVFIQEQEQQFGRDSKEYELAHHNFMETDK